MSALRYRGFTIESRADRIRASSACTVALEISRRGRARPFGLLEHCRSENESDARGFDVGRRIIDGRIPGWSVDSMRGSPRFDPDQSAFERLRRHAIGTFLFLAAIAVVALLSAGQIRG